MKVVFDTNVLVSAILTNGTPAAIADLMANEKLMPFYNDVIIEEYWDVLHRPKFNFQNVQINKLLDSIVKVGVAVEVNVYSNIKMLHEDDRKFYDVAKTALAYLRFAGISIVCSISYILLT